MAKSESQGLQIAVIILAFITIVLCAFTFWFFKEWSDTDEKLQAAVRAQEQADQKARVGLDEIAKLKEWIGVAQTDTIDKVEEVYNKDMTEIAGALEENQKKYHQALLELQAQNDIKDQALVAERERLNQFKAKIDKLEANWTQKLAGVQTAFNQKADDFDGEKGRFKEENDRVTAEKEQLAQNLRDSHGELAKLAAAKDDEINKLKGEVQSLTAQRNKATDQIKELTTETFEVADGEIRWVSPTQPVVWINLGHAHGLAKQITFSVFGRDENGVARKERKAAIEVTEILGENLAEAKILEDKLTDPILPDDFIYTPLWHPGRREHFAVVGEFDVNEDGIFDDLDVVKALIRVNGGVIDEALNDDGTREKTGEGMSIQTRYIVTGEAPKDAAGAGEFSKMVADADKLGIETMTLPKFLDHIGFVGRTDLVRFGLLSNPEDFKDVKRPSERGAPRVPKFRERRPFPPLPDKGEDGGAY